MPHKPEDRVEAAALRQAMGKRIRTAREALGWSQERLAEAISVGPDMLGRYERGAKFPSHLSLVRLSDVLGVSVDALLGRRGSEKLARPSVRADDALSETLGKLTPRQRDAVVQVVRELTTRSGRARKARPTRSRRT